MFGDLPTKQTSLFISSTSRDLSKHRELLKSKLTQMGLSYIAMEEFTAADADAIDVSLEAVRKCDVFIGIYARRYGFVPLDEHKNPKQLSVTELEYHEAVRLKLPRLLFEVEDGYGANTLIETFQDIDDPVQNRKLSAFLDQARKERVFARFTTEELLTAKVLAALKNLKYWRIPEPPTLLDGANYLVRESLSAADIGNALESHPLVALTGIGGIGKSTLAYDTAQKLRSRFTGGILWLNLSMNEDADERVERTILEWAHFFPYKSAQTSEKELTQDLIRTWMTEVIILDGRMLLVLDNVWQTDVVHALRRLLPNDTPVLITTRRVDVAASLDAFRVDVERFTDEEGARFLQSNLRGKHFATPAYSTLLKIAQNLHGHPLALSMIANIIHKQQTHSPGLVTTLPERLSSEATSLRILSEDSNSDVESALTITYSYLDEELKRRFRALGALPIDLAFPFDIAGALWGDDLDDPHAADNVRDKLERLVDMALLSRRGETYVQHPLLRASAITRFLETEGQEALEQAQIDYERYIYTVTDNKFIEPQHFFSILNDYLPHIHYVGDLLTTRVRAHLLDIGINDLSNLAVPYPDFNSLEKIRSVSIVHDFFEEISHFCYAAIQYLNARFDVGERGQRWLEAGLAAAHVLEKNHLIIRHLFYLGHWYERHGYHVKALPFLQRALELVPPDYPLERARILEILGQIHGGLGDLDQQIVYLKQAMAIYREANASIEADLLYFDLGRVLLQQGRTTQALEIFRRVTDITRSIDMPYTLASSLLSIGQILFLRSEWNSGQLLVEEAIRIYEEFGDTRMAMQAQRVLAEALLLQGYTHQVNDILYRCELLARQNDDQTELVIILLMRAMMLTELGQYNSGISESQKAIDIATHLGDKKSEISAYSFMAVALARSDRLVEAKHIAEHALGMARQKGIEADWGLLNTLGVISIEEGNFQLAESILSTALESAQKTNIQTGELKTLNNLAILALNTGRKQQAVEYLERSVEISRRSRLRLTLANALMNLGLAQSSLGNKSAALASMQEALKLSEELKSFHGLPILIHNLVLIQTDLGGNKEEGLKLIDHGLYLARQQKERSAEILLLILRAHLLIDLNQADAAIASANLALAFARELGVPNSLVETLYGYAGIFYKLKHWAKARAALSECLNLMERHNLASISGEISQRKVAGEFLIILMRERGCFWSIGKLLQHATIFWITIFLKAIVFVLLFWPLVILIPLTIIERRLRPHTMTTNMAKPAYWYFALLSSILIWAFKDVQHYISRADVWEKLNYSGRALSDYDKALQLEASNPRALYKRGRLLLENQRYAEALTDLEQSATLLPQNLEIALWRAKAVFETGDYDRAAKLLSPLLSDSKQAAEAHLYLAYIGQVHGDYDQAHYHLGLATYVSPKAIQFIYILERALMYMRVNNLERAEPLLTEVLKKQPSAIHYYWYSLYLIQQGNYDQSAEYLRRSREKAPLSRAYDELWLGVIAKRRGASDQAQSIWKHGQTFIERVEYAIHRQMCAALYKLAEGDIEGARALYREAANLGAKPHQFQRQALYIQILAHLFDQIPDSKLILPLGETDA